MGFMRSVLLSALALAATCRGVVVPGAEAEPAVEKRASSYWYENIAKQGVAPFAPSGYTVYRNVKDFGAKGDGVTDDTAAINNAILSGGRCGRLCKSSTLTPAIVYFPAGTYLISTPIIDQYYTNIIGDATNLPTIKATANFNGIALIDGDTYYGDNNPNDPNWISTNVFYRQVRNFKLDMTSMPASAPRTYGIHWPTAQATSLQNIQVTMSTASGNQQVGLFVENGSAGFLTDLTFNGGLIGAAVGNQQFTMRNLVFNNCGTAIVSGFTWEWVYQGISINNCGLGIDISSAESITLIDSSITGTPVGIRTSYSASQTPPTSNSLIIENLSLNNVPVAVQSTSGATLLAGGTTTIAAWGQGHQYTPNGPTSFQGTIAANARPSSLLSGSKYYTRSKPQYETLPVSSFKSVRSAGATGNAVTDDTAALQNIINSATAAGQIVYFDAGIYRVTSTLKIPPGAKLVGEEYPIILSSGSFFNDQNNPKPVVQVGTPGQTGQVEWSDMIVATQGTQAGAVLIEWNLATSGTPSGMWDVHTRIGGFKGSNLQLAQCPVTAGSTAVNTACIGAYMSMHITSSASNLYMENNWLWTADHDIEDANNSQITIFSGRGLYVESTAGTFWFVGTAVEHHVLYQYQFANTQNIYAGVIQTETPYYQPNPLAPTPFTVNSAINDPNFATSCAGQSGRCAEAWGLRILGSKNVLIYAAGLYSFFENNDGKGCNNGVEPQNCQNNIVDLEGTLTNINIYNLGTVGVVNSITENGNVLAASSANANAFADVIALFRLASGSGGTNPPPPSSTTKGPTTMSTITTSSSPPKQTGWSSLGCYSDNVNGRTLANQVQVAGGASAMSVEACETACKAAGYTIAGVEYSGECWCDNKFENGGGPASDGNAQCTMTCSGAPQETCGGPNRLNVYQVATATGAPPPVTTGWVSRGCYTDSVNARALIAEGVPNGPTSMTVEACQSVCKSLGYVLAGLEFADECYCGNSLANGNTIAPDGNAGCNMNCAGNAAEICGGSNRLSLYSYGSASV
ncbi:Glucan 1,3-beta-glucosidase [Trichoderma lentiforme]|uniref:Glucan 1,3-beta-glucosidase n=1 Tax=Trichoderma lentiforme TaxID=1567552 RepID=A0A9P4X2M3_9HYPO|nr:Glucan 1,3-beta-glucosidase [Trichoderma lentiforme]